MIVEHVFVTTLEGPDALRLASQFLGSRGFEAAMQTAFVLDGGGWNVLEMRRGKKSAAKAKSAIELPQQLRLEFDRGRVTLALSALTVQESRMTSNKPKGKEAREIGEMLTGLAMHLQYLLGDRVDPASLQARWGQVEEHLDRLGRGRKRRNLIILLVVLTLLIGGIVALAVLANP